MSEILNELKNRGIFNNCSDEELIDSLKGKGVYIGFDPSANSLHLGNYIQITILKRFAEFGFKPIAVIGGGTGMIGDPSGKSKERNLLSEETLNDNVKSITKEIERFNIKTINNFDFYKDMTIIDFLRKVGKLLNINYMLAKESVKNRIDTGMSFTEFSYQLIQGWDFKVLNEKHDVFIQLGGSDQWGNITSGLEMIRKTNLGPAAGITTNLLVKSDGKKFGKSEGGALYLNKDITSPYAMYQYLYNQNDDDAKKLCFWLLFKPVSEIKDIIQEHDKNPKLNLVQKSLASNVVEDIHGKAELDNALEITRKIFKNSNELTFDDIEQILHSVKSTKVDPNSNLLDILKESSIVSSNREAREFINSGALKINGEKIQSENQKVDFNKYNNTYAFVQKGKKNFFILISK
ncbi:MAG: tyrosine--tRNA ligase [Mycoplasma sp.]|nr:tyrosine--tRNA ligase [Mycoplasma sp.]